MNCSFTPSGSWFVFDEHGMTIKTGFHTKALAVAWIRLNESPS